MRIDAVPIWILFAATIAVVMISIEVGYRLGRAALRRSEEEKESPVSAIAGTVLGLSSFMLAFTFGIVSARYDTKKAMVRDDAVAVRTAWQRSDFLPETDRAEARDLLRRYVDLRLTFVEGRTVRPDRVQSITSDTQRMLDRLWNMAVANARKDMNSDVAALYIESLNDVSEIHARRVAIAIQARIPVEAWLVLYCITVLGTIGVGYQTGIAASKRSAAQALLAVAFALVFGLIASLDRPDSGVMKVSQQPLMDLRDLMTAAAGGADLSLHGGSVPVAPTEN